MNLSVNFNKHSKSQFLSLEQVEEFGGKVDAIRRQVMDDLGEKDAEYIYKSGILSVIAKLLRVAC